MCDCLIVGAGVIGLSIAYELSSSGLRVHVVDAGNGSTRRTSWAAAGILPAPQSLSIHDAVEQLRLLSHKTFPEWSSRLLGQTGIDNELHQCGGLHIARRHGEAAALRAAVVQMREDGVDVHEVNAAELPSLEPNLAESLDSSGLLSVYLMPDEMQVRPPRHLKALHAACCKQNVTFHDGPRCRLVVADDQIVGVETQQGTLSANTFCIAAGAWSQELLGNIGMDVLVEPYRGQMLMWELDRPLVSHVINEGPRYILNRTDGKLLVGSSVEEAGFVCEVTQETVGQLTDFATSLFPDLAAQPYAKAWAGLRPGSGDGAPYIGRVSPFENLVVATGHFRSGIHLSTGTAILVRQIICEEEPSVDLRAFRLNRN